MVSPFKPLTREDAADILGVSLGTLDKLIASGTLPAPRTIGGCRRQYWHPDCFYAWLDQQLRADPQTETTEIASTDTSGRRSFGRKASPAMGLSVRARARDAERLAKLNRDP